MHNKTRNENMLNSCFRFRCAIVQAGSVVIFPPPLSQPPLSSLWATCFLATFISAAPPTSSYFPHHTCGSFWGFSRLAVGKIIFQQVFITFWCSIWMRLACQCQADRLTRLASTLFTVKLLPNCATIVISGCRATMYDVVGCAIAQTCPCGCHVERNLSMNYGISTWCCWHFEYSSFHPNKLLVASDEF